MAAVNQEKLLKGVLKGVLKEIGKGKDDPSESVFEKIAAAEAAKAKEGKGMIGGAIAGAQARGKVADEWRVATQGTKGRRSAFFSGLLGRDVSGLMKNFGLEKMESPEAIKEARAKFGLDKKEKGDKGGVGKLAKPLSLILRNVIQTQKMVRNIEKALTKPSLKSGYTFDPRMVGGGRYKSTTTNKIVSAKEATGASGKGGVGAALRTAALTAAIGADEQPLVKLQEFLQLKLKDFDAKKVMAGLNNIAFSLNGVTPTVGLLSVHDKLNMLLAKSSFGGFDRGGGNRRNRRGRKGGGPRRGGGGIGLGGLVAGAAGGFLAYQAVDSLRDPNLVSEDPEVLKQQAMEAKSPEEKKVVGDQIAAQKKDIKLQAGATAAGGAGAVAGAVAAKKIGQTAVVKNVKSKAWDLFVNFVKKKAPKLFAKVGARLAVAGGLATIPFVGWVSAAVTVVGSLWLAYDLYKLWNEFSALTDAEKALYDEKAQQNAVKPAAVKETAPPPKPPVTAATPSALPGGSTVAAATTTAAAIPAAMGGAAAPTAPTPPAAEPKTMLQTAVEKAKEIGSGVVTGAKQVATAVKEFFTGPSPKLDQVTTKQNAGVDTSGLQGGMQERLARMAKAFQEATGKKLMLTSAFRSDDKQMKLWTAKYNEMKAANPNASEAQLTKMTRKWVALPMALGGKGSAHNRGTAVDINSKGAAGIEAINGMTFNGQKVTTDSFLAMFGLKRPLAHEPWHLQPLEGAPTPDNPDPNAKPLVADAKGNMVNLETGKAESIPPPAPMSAQTNQSKLPPVSDSGGPPPAAVGAEKQEQKTMTAAAAAASPAPAANESIAPAAVDPLATKSDGTAIDANPMVAQTAPTDSLVPVQNTTGSQVAQGSSQLETSKMVAAAAPPAPVVINNNSGGGQQKPIESPRQPLPRASSRSSESTFSRALAKDFSHPSAITSSVA